MWRRDGDSCLPCCSAAYLGDVMRGLCRCRDCKTMQRDSYLQRTSKTCFCTPGVSDVEGNLYFWWCRWVFCAGRRLGRRLHSVWAGFLFLVLARLRLGLGRVCSGPMFAMDLESGSFQTLVVRPTLRTDFLVLHFKHVNSLFVANRVAVSR